MNKHDQDHNKLGKNVRTPENNCPVCKSSIDAATCIENDCTPEQDDISLCLYCSSVNAFNSDLTLRAMTDSEIGDLPHEVRQHIQKARKAIREVMKV